MDIRPSFESVQGAFDIPATVTLLDGSSVETTVVWLLPSTEDHPHGVDIRRAEAKRILCLSKEDVPDVPRGLLVTVPEFDGGDDLVWMVDSIERIEFDHTRALVVPAPVTP